MTKALRNRLVLIGAVLLGCVLCAFPIEKRINLGLDLKGGMHLVLKVDTEELSENAKSDAVVRAIEILRRRLDPTGGREIVLQRQGEDEILVQLPGVTDREEALALVKRVANLSFHFVNNDPLKIQDALNGNVPKGFLLRTTDDGDTILISEKPAMKGDNINDARVDFDQETGMQPKVSLSFNGKGAKEFGKLTQENVGDSLAIVLDDQVLSAPRINEPILGGNAEISGQFSSQKAKILALALRSGALPAPMHVEEERTIGPLLGKDSINAGIRATAIGGSLVFAFMLMYYLLAGLISTTALIINLFMIVGIMGFLNLMLPSYPMTLTLPGIAGIILTLGMAVDANVLINERIREEIDNGQPLTASINSGFSKALKAIVDSNLTTLIAAFMLFQFGSGPIKGFAVTLSIGLMASLFTALYVTKTLYEVLIQNFKDVKIKMLSLIKEPKFNFISVRWVCFALSAILLSAGLINFFNQGEKAYGIDFVGGQIQEYRFERPVENDALRVKLKETGLDDAIIQKFDQEPRNVIIRTGDDTYDQVTTLFKTHMADNPFQILRVEKVGPVVGKALRERAILAILFAMAGILLFVGFRFKHFDFATAGIIALLHDVILTTVILVFLGRQIDLLVVTALLTIAGYSINDTIIIYDRVRENLVKDKKSPLKDILNLSVNQTLSRTLLTTITTLLVVVTLFLKGGEVLNTFALTLIIGFIAGTYSTIFIASPLVLAWQKKKK